MIMIPKGSWLLDIGIDIEFVIDSFIDILKVFLSDVFLHHTQQLMNYFLSVFIVVIVIR